MGLTKWITSKLVFSLLIFAGFYVLGEALGVVPKSVENIFGWFASNFLLITVLLISFMVFYVALRLTGPKRVEHA